MPGATTTAGDRRMSRDIVMRRFASGDGKHRHPEVVLRRSMAGLRNPLSTLRHDPRGTPRMMGGGLSPYGFTVEDFYLLPPAGLPAHPSTPSPKAAE